MKRIFGILLLAMLLGAVERWAPAATHVVRMTRFSTFDPKDITIERGDTVTWTNVFSIFHDAVSFDGHWKSPLFGFRGTYSFTFNLPPGRYDYFCTPHLSIGMVGSVTVLGPANTAPTAAILSPANGAVFESTETVAVTVETTDDAGVAKVDLLVDGAVAQTLTAPPFQFGVTLPPGPHTLAARATDGPGLTGESAPVSITVRPPNAAPTVAITSPAQGSSFTSPIDLAIEATATDDGAIQRVEFFVNGELIGADTSFPYSVARTFTQGVYRLRADAFDDTGLGSSSAEITISVDEPVPVFPQVTILIPTQDEYVETNVVLAAEAVDPDGTIARVEFFEGTNSLGNAAPAGANRFELATVFPEGRRTISAIATDNEGNATISAPVSFVVALRPVLTSQTVLSNGVVRASAFGTSGVPFVFEYSEDMTTWTPFLTNQLYRRILFFDDPTAAGRPARAYRLRSPTPPSPSVAD